MNSQLNSKKLLLITKQINKVHHYSLISRLVIIQILIFTNLIFIANESFSQSITSFSPTSGTIGSSVTITGSGFNTTAANNIVFFGATRGTVTSASATSINVTVPAGATHAPITVLNTATSLTAYSTAFFVPTFSPNKDSIAATDISPRIDYSAGGQPKVIAVSDFDGDGKPDLTTANISLSNPNFIDTVSVFRNTSSSGNINFAPKLNFTTAGNNFSLTVADIDGDGKPDIISLNANQAKISVLRNTSSLGNISFATASQFNISNLNGTATSIASGDLNGDGKPEVVVVGGMGLTNVAVFRNQSTPGIVSFASDVYFEVSTGPRFVGIGDITGDGKPEIVAVSDGFGVVSVLRNTTITSISFATKTDFTVSANPYALAIGDLNGDGKHDVAVANNTTNVFVLRNTSTTSAVSFATPVSYAAGTSPASVAIADLNGDGKLDLAVANGTSGNLSLLRNNGSGGVLSMSAATTIDGPQPPLGLQPLSLAIGDLNADGTPDLATANSYFTSNNTLSVYRNNPRIPEIIRTGSITNFSACTGNTSTSQSFSIRGINLVANITITAPSGFEISTSQSSGYTSSIILNRTADSVGITTIYVRMSSAASGTPTGNISCTTTWAATQNILLNGLVKLPTSSNNNLSICPSALPYSWNGLTFTAAGTQTKTGLTNATGCDSSATLNLSVKSNSSSTTNLSICPSALPYSWNGLTFTAAGTQTKTGLTNAAGCDSSATLNLSVKSNSSSTTNLSICPSALPYSWNGLTFTAAGTQTKTGLTNVAGCDSSATLNLSVKSNSSSTTNLSICPSALPYSWNGLTFTAAGTQTKTGLTNVAGCDSSATLNLSVKSNSSSTTNLSICPSALPYSWNGLTFTAAGTQTKTGLTNAAGCDSSATLNLSVKSNSSSTTNLSICPSALPYSWNGLTFTAAGTQTKTGLTNVAGCDSSATLNLSVKSNSSSTTNLSICPSALPYSWNGLTFTAAGTQTKTGLTNAAGCDSSATLNLTVKSNSSSTTNLSICPSALPYSWNGLTFTAAGTQTKTGLTNAAGCDSSATLNLTVNTKPETGIIVGPTTGLNPLTNYNYLITQQLNVSYKWNIINGIIVSGQGTNSVTIQWLTAGTGKLNVLVTNDKGCSDSAVLDISIINVGANELAENTKLLVFPNPAISEVTIKVDAILIGASYKLVDTKGVEMLKGTIERENESIDINNLSSGMYYLLIDNHKLLPIKLVKGE